MIPDTPDDTRQHLILVVARLLRPIARMLMRVDFSYAQFEEVAKRVFVEQALGEPDRHGRRTNTSRVAVRTGLSRKEVARIKRDMADASTILNDVEILGRPIRALQLWFTDPRFHDERGRPLDLPFEGDEVSFTSLVKLVGGDIPAGAVRAELLAAESIDELEDGTLRARKRCFVPTAIGDDVRSGFTHLITPALETLNHNLNDPARAHVQRVAYSDRLRAAQIPDFRAIAQGEAKRLMSKIDEELIAREVPAGLVVEDNPRLRVGVGVYYFETTDDDAGLGAADD